MRYVFVRSAVPVVLGLGLSACAALAPSVAPRIAPPPAGSSATLAVLETTDLHANVLGYDYYRLHADPSFGFDRVVTQVKLARREFANTLLLDDGDTIQGTALADYQALAAPLPCDRKLAIYKAMDYLGYDGGGIGNHEFSYGLPYLNQVTGSHFDVDGVAPDAPRCAGPAYPLVLANVYSSRTHQPLFAPYRIITKQVSVTGPHGEPEQAMLKIGIIGFTPPVIMAWDKRWLDGKIYTEGWRETAQKYVPEMRAQGADLIVALSHGGLDDSPYAPTMENGSYYLAQVPGIDALLIGHSHLVFPDAASKVAQFNLPGVDKVRGTVNGVPTVMAGLWGKQLGVIALALRYDGHAWSVDRGATKVEARGGAVAHDAAIAPLVAAEHEATIRYVQTPIGSSDFRMSTYFADAGDVSAVELVNQAQTAYLAAYVKANLPQYAQLPVLSVASPFKTGAAGVGDYTDVPAGHLGLNNAADLYLYPNTLTAVRVSGAQLKAWLEKSAQRFNRIAPASAAPQELVNPSYAGFNFDELTDADVSYLIDVTQPAGQRISDLRYRGAAVAADQQFLVATNNYRASGGGQFPGLDGSNIVLAAPDENREVLIDYIKAHPGLNRAQNGASRSWHFARVHTAGPVVFHSAPGVLELARQAGLANITLLKADDGGGKGYALYSIDLSR